MQRCKSTQFRRLRREELARLSRLTPVNLMDEPRSTRWRSGVTVEETWTLPQTAACGLAQVMLPASGNGAGVGQQYALVSTRLDGSIARFRSLSIRELSGKSSFSHSSQPDYTLAPAAACATRPPDGPAKSDRGGKDRNALAVAQNGYCKARARGGRQGANRPRQSRAPIAAGVEGWCWAEL